MLQQANTEMEIVAKFFELKLTFWLLGAALIFLVLEMTLQLPYLFLAFALTAIFMAMANALGVSGEWQAYLVPPFLILAFALQRQIYKSFTNRSISSHSSGSKYVGQHGLLHVIEEDSGAAGHFYQYKSQISVEPPVAEVPRVQVLRASLPDGSVHVAEWRGLGPARDGAECVVIGELPDRLIVGPIN